MTLIGNITATLEGNHSIPIDNALQDAGCLFEKARGVGEQLNEVLVVR
jgi:hypothetical protein